MRTITLDQFEFESSASEEFLEISVARKSKFPYPDMRSFLQDTIGMGDDTDLPEPVSFQENWGYGLVRKYLQKYAGYQLPNKPDFLFWLIKAGPVDWQIAWCEEDQFICYVWGTTA